MFIVRGLLRRSSNWQKGSMLYREVPLMPDLDSLDQEINREEQKLGIRLDPEQRTAITTALQSPISVITGAPELEKHPLRNPLRSP